MNSINPVFYLIIFGFFIWSSVAKGTTNEQAAKVFASFVGATFLSSTLLLFIGILSFFVWIFCFGFNEIISLIN